MKALDHFLVLREQSLRHVRLKCFEEFFLTFKFSFPIVRFHREQFGQLFTRNTFKSAKIQIRWPRNPPYRCLFRTALPVAAIDDPFQHPHVFTEAWPKKSSVRSFAKPIHVENEGWFWQPAANFKPVLKVITHAVSTKRQHRHRITSYLAHRAGRGRSRLGRHGCANVNTVSPIEGAEHQRHRVATTSSENYGTDRYALSLLNVGIEHGIV